MGLCIARRWVPSGIAFYGVLPEGVVFARAHKYKRFWMSHRRSEILIPRIVDWMPEIDLRSYSRC